MKRGDVWWAGLPAPAGRRPVVLVSRNEAYAVRELVIVVPVTTRARSIPTEVPLGREEGFRAARSPTRTPSRRFPRPRWWSSLVPSRRRRCRRSMLLYGSRSTWVTASCSSSWILRRRPAGSPCALVDLSGRFRRLRPQPLDHVNGLAAPCRIERREPSQPGSQFNSAPRPRRYAAVPSCPPWQAP